ncbi:MAG: HAD-IA family hydrolase [Patescibacteria group bacterium]
MIKAIAFDYGGVIEIKEGDLIQEIVDYLNISREDWENVYYTFNYLTNTGKNTWPEVAAMVAAKLEASDIQIARMQEIIQKSNANRKINSGLIGIMKDLKGKGYKIALLSNNGVALRNRLEDQGILDLFDAVIISAEVGYQKPSSEIFEILFTTLGVDSGEVVFIDDSKKSLEGAESIGYTPLLFTSNQKLEEDLLNVL